MIKNVVLDVRSSAHLGAFLIKQGLLFFCTSQILEACACDRTPYMPKHGSYFFLCNFSVKLPWLQRRGNKLNITLFDRYYSQNCKAVIFRKIINHTKYK